MEDSIDPEDKGEVDHSTVWLGISTPGQMICLPMKQDIADWFRARGPGYPARINAVLRDDIDAQKAQKRDAAAAPASRR